MKKAKDKKVFRSMIEIEKEYYPNKYKEKMNRIASEDNKASDSLARLALENIKKEMNVVMDVC